MTHLSPNQHEFNLINKIVTILQEYNGCNPTYCSCHLSDTWQFFLFLLQKFFALKKSRKTGKKKKSTRKLSELPDNTYLITYNDF